MAPAYSLQPRSASRILLVLDINNQRRRNRVTEPHPLEPFEFMQCPIVDAEEMGFELQQFRDVKCTGYCGHAIKFCATEFIKVFCHSAFDFRS